MGMTPQHLHTILTSCAILHKYALCLLAVCRGGLWKAVHVVGSAGCVVHVDVHGEWVMVWLAAMSIILSMADMVCLACMQKLRSTWIVVGLYGMLEFKLCCEILLLLNIADMDQWKAVEWAMLSTLFI